MPFFTFCFHLHPLKFFQKSCSSLYFSPGYAWFLNDESTCENGFKILLYCLYHRTYVFKWLAVSINLIYYYYVFPFLPITSEAWKARPKKQFSVYCFFTFTFHLAVYAYVQILPLPCIQTFCHCKSPSINKLNNQQSTISQSMYL